ncbi:MAG: methyltransferase domain-containing protein [Burkholderiaceae bacterium]
MSEPSSERHLPINPAHVARQFARRGATQPFIYAEVARRMAERLELIKLAPAVVVDAGCGAGAALPILHARYPKVQIIGIDHASRIEQARHAWPDTGLRAKLRTLTGGARVAWQAGDFASAVPAQTPIDLVWSNCALHWAAAPHEVIKHWASWLATGGLLMFSTFGPDTFKQVRAAAMQAGLQHSTLPFVDMHDFGDMMVAAGLATPVMDVEVLTLTYASPQALVDELRALGGNAHGQRTPHLTGRARWQRFLDALAAQADAEGRIPLTIEIAYGHAWKPAPKPPPGVATVSVQSLKESLKSRGPAGS